MYNKNYSVDQLHDLTKIDKWYLYTIDNIVQTSRATKTVGSGSDPDSSKCHYSLECINPAAWPVTKDRLMQGCMRIRKLGYGHSALNKRDESLQQHAPRLKAKGTRSQYDGHLVRGRRFLADVFEQKKTSQTVDGTHTQADGELVDIDAYSHAFDDIPNQYSAPALELFLVQKGLTEGRSLSTTWGMFSAFNDLWKNAQGETYREPYHFNPATGIVSWKPGTNNEGAEGGCRNHASAMTIEDMRKIMAWSYKQCPDELISLIYSQVQSGLPLDMDEVISAQKHLVIRAFTTTGFMIWTQNFELTKIRCKDVVWNCQGLPPYNIPYDLVSLLNRKGWQRKGETDGALEERLLGCSLVLSLKNRRLSLPFGGGVHGPEGESVDTLIRYLLDELTRYEKNHRDALCPIPREGDKIFNGNHIITAPVTAAETRELKMSFDRELTRLSGKVEEVLDKLTLTPPVSSSSSPSPPPSQFPQLSISTPIPSLPSPLLSPPPAQPLQQTPSHEASHEPLSGSYTTSSATHNVLAVNSQLSPAPLSSAAIQIRQAHQHSTHQHTTATKKNAPIPGIGIPDLPRGLEAWRAAVKQWEDPAASIGGKALKDWPEEWYTGPMCTITGVKRNICKVIATEFYQLHGDDRVFLEEYPEANRGAKPLFDAIQHKHEGRGEITGRASKNGRPEVRASTSR
ncbi:hypothetical protein DFJ58DRAFT_863766 [Suillus subalutaceus]|uniref:uncharacterized protein n=1 Tax=Suillus subalutaceus TaxID=48586 RepID=UPI001B87D023|nr:uncharacterized protein DFJ58DRAFT_863766 [Suillus subalutaceus]KAG1865934.1 hypothetical protein DFJ58DRAFT_863766 [Suillus subalutaceus]